MPVSDDIRLQGSSLTQLTNGMHSNKNTSRDKSHNKKELIYCRLNCIFRFVKGEMQALAPALKFCKHTPSIRNI